MDTPEHDIRTTIHEAATTLWSVARPRGYALSGVAVPEPGGDAAAPDAPGTTHLLLTSARAVAGADRVAVHRGEAAGDPPLDAEPLHAEVVGRAPELDVALLRLPEATSVPAARWRDDVPELGEVALRLGRQRGRPRVARGVVAYVGPAWGSPTGGRFDRRLVVDAAPFRGYSGGPVIDGHGRLLGTSSSALDRDDGVIVDPATLRRAAGQLLASGRTSRPRLGIALQPVRLPGSDAEPGGDARRRPRGANGLVVLSVAPESAAERAGLRVGDILLAADGRRLRRPSTLAAILAEATPDENTVALTLLRGGETVDLEVEVADGSEGEPGAAR